MSLQDCQLPVTRPDGFSQAEDPVKIEMSGGHSVLTPPVSVGISEVLVSPMGMFHL